MLRIAIQKSGRLHEDSLKLLNECGISIENGRDQLRVRSRNFPLDVYYLRNGDIPKYLKDGIVDCAIIGQNLLTEKAPDLEARIPLGFSKCRVSLAVPRGMEYTDLKDLHGKQIATSYPKTLQRYLDEHGIDASIHQINGSVEIAPNIGLSDGIMDIVSSGSTLFKNNLKEVVKIMDSQAVLAVKPGASNSTLSELCFRIESVLKARNYRYVLLNAPNDKLEQICAILPGMKSPTVLPLADRNWSSIHSVLPKQDFWELIDKLKKAGAQGVLVCPIEKMVI